MFDLEGFFAILDKHAPLELSKKLIEKGDYDNSGILIKSNKDVKRVLFSLDLSMPVVKRAKYLRADTIVTHHPAIYKPIKNLSYDDVATAPLLKAIRYGMNVISMHLNLDVAEGGIDATLCAKLGGESYKVIEPLDEKFGYGREFEVQKTSLFDFVEKAKDKFESKKIIFYGKKKNTVKKVASFCGAGGNHVINAINKGLITADTIVTSDVSQHEIKDILEAGKNLVILTHYVSEEVGFKEYYKKIKSETGNFAELIYFDDKRFR